MIGGFVLMSPILLHNFLPLWAPNPFAETPHPVAFWAPQVALVVIPLAFLLLGRRKAGETTTAWLFRSLGRTPLYVAVLSGVMILTGTADLQRQFGFGRHVAALIDARGKGSHTSPTLVELIVLVFVGLAATTGYIALYVKLVIKASWFYQDGLRQKTARPNGDADKPRGPTPVEITEAIHFKIRKALDKTITASYTVRLLAGFMYAAIGTSAYLYFAFGRERYLHDPVASSFGLTAYAFNLVLVAEGFRAWFVGLWYGETGTPDALELSKRCTRILTWSLKNAGAALVYVWTLGHGGLDKGAELLTKHIIPGWSRFQAWALSNVFAVVLLGVVANRIDWFFITKRKEERIQSGASHDRRERAAALLRKRSPRP